MPQQDTGQLIGFIRGDDGLSFQVMQPKMEIYRRAAAGRSCSSKAWPGFIGGSGGINNAFMIVRSEAQSAERKVDGSGGNQPSAPVSVPKVPGGRMFLMPDQDLQIGGREGSQLGKRVHAAGQATSMPCVTWLPPVREALRAKLPELTDIDAKEGRGCTQQIQSGG